MQKRFEQYGISMAKLDGKTSTKEKNHIKMRENLFSHPVL